MDGGVLPELFDLMAHYICLSLYNLTIIANLDFLQNTEKMNLKWLALQKLKTFCKFKFLIQKQVAKNTESLTIEFS